MFILLRELCGFAGYFLFIYGYLPNRRKGLARLCGKRQLVFGNSRIVLRISAQNWSVFTQNCTKMTQKLPVLLSFDPILNQF
jgi:hypothetical protein